MKRYTSKREAPKFGRSSLRSPSKNGRPDMNSNKWRTVKIPQKTLEDLVSSHLYAMRGMSKREIIDMGIPVVVDEEGMVTIKIKMKEQEVKAEDQSAEEKNAKMASRT
jgi:hypothetical protein